MKTFSFNSVGKTWSADAETWQDAIKKLWGVGSTPGPGDVLGLVTSMHVDGEETLYFSTLNLLKAAELKVQE